MMLAMLLLLQGAASLSAPPRRRRPLSIAVRGGKTTTVRRGGAQVAEVPQPVKLLFGAGGIYAAFLYYGSLQEDVFRYQVDGQSFKEVWFLQVLEAAMNVVVGFIGLMLTGGSSPGLPLRLLGCTGATQVLAKYCTNAALAYGVSFPVVTLAKSGKMVPVMLGSLLLGGATYTLRQYLQVAAIVGGTAIVSMSSKRKTSAGTGTALGLACISASLCFDGFTGGIQKRVKFEATNRGVKPKPYDYMFWTNCFMFATAFLFAAFRSELSNGVRFCLANPVILTKILKFGACSAFGQSFIFYTIANFDPLVCATITSSRKVFSVLLSILLKGHNLSLQGWIGVALASAGILADAFSKKRH